MILIYYTTIMEYIKLKVYDNTLKIIKTAPPKKTHVILSGTPRRITYQLGPIKWGLVMKIENISL